MTGNMHSFEYPHSTFSITYVKKVMTVFWSLLLHVIPDDKVLLIAFCLNDGPVDIVETGEFELTILQLATCLMLHGKVTAGSLCNATTSIR